MNRFSGPVRNQWDAVLRDHVVQGIPNEAGVPLVVPEEYGHIRVLFKAGDDLLDQWENTPHDEASVREEIPDLVVAGYASPQVIDKEKHLITKEALKADLPRFLAHPHYRNAMIVHTNIQVGEVLPEWTHPKTGEVYKTKVDDIGLFCVVRIRTDQFRPAIVDQVIKDIEEGKLRAFSVSGDAPYESRKYQCNDGTCFWVITKIELYEITICEEGINQDAKYSILSKAVLCKDGICSIRLPQGYVTKATIRRAVAHAEEGHTVGNHQGAESATGLVKQVQPGPPKDEGIRGPDQPALGQGRTGNMQGGNEGAEVQERAGGGSVRAAEESKTMSSAEDELFAAKRGHEEGADEHKRAVAFLWQHGGAYLGNAELSRAADLELKEGRIHLTLRALKSRQTSSIYSADQINEAVRLALGHVGKSAFLDQKIHPELKQSSQSTPGTGGFHMGDHSKQVGQGARHTRSRSGTVSDPQFDELQLPMAAPENKHDTPRSPHKEHDPRVGSVKQTVPAPSVAEHRKAWAEYEDLHGGPRPQVLYHWTTSENARQILSDEGDHAVFLPSDNEKVSPDVFFSPNKEDLQTEERMPEDSTQLAVFPDYSDTRWMPAAEAGRGNDVIYQGNLATDRVRIVQRLHGSKEDKHDTPKSPHKVHGPKGEGREEGGGGGAEIGQHLGSFQDWELENALDDLLVRIGSDEAESTDPRTTISSAERLVSTIEQAWANGAEEMRDILTEGVTSGSPRSSPIAAYIADLKTRTQKDLAEKGIEELTLYRGLRSNFDVSQATNAASFTSDRKVAEEFSQGGQIIEAKVPRSAVLGYHGSGLGTEQESEFVLTPRWYARGVEYNTVSGSPVEPATEEAGSYWKDMAAQQAQAEQTQKAQPRESGMFRQWAAEEGAHNTEEVKEPVLPQCQHGCAVGDLTVETMQDMLESGELVVPKKDKEDGKEEESSKEDKAEGNLDMLARPYGGPHSDEVSGLHAEVAEHEPYGSIQRRRDQPGETESEEHYLNKAMDTATVVLCVALGPDGMPVAGIRQDRKHGKRYEFPGGHVQAGETPARAAERELLEESGVKGKAIRKLGEKKSPNNGVPVIFVQLEVLGGQPGDSSELTDVHYCDPDKVDWAFDDSKEMVNIALGGALDKNDTGEWHTHPPDFEEVHKHKDKRGTTEHHRKQYHATSPENAQSILKEGLRHGVGQANFSTSQKGKVYLTSDPMEAAYYGYMAQKPGGSGRFVVLEVNLTDEQIDKLEEDPAATKPSITFTLADNIGPENIGGMVELPGQREGEYKGVDDFTSIYEEKLAALGSEKIVATEGGVSYIPVSPEVAAKFTRGLNKHQSAKDHSHSEGFVWEETLGIRKGPQAIGGVDIPARNADDEGFDEDEERVSDPRDLGVSDPPDIGITEKADIGSAGMTILHEPLIQTNDLGVVRKAASCPLCRSVGFLSKALDSRIWRSTADENLRLATRFTLATLQQGVSSVLHKDGTWFALAGDEAPQGIIHKGWAVDVPVLVSQVGKHSLDVGLTDLWTDGYSLRGQLDRFRPVRGKDAYNMLEEIIARLFEAREGFEGLDTAVRDRYTGVVSDMLALLTDYQVREELGGFNPLQDPFGSDSSKEEYEEEMAEQSTPATDKAFLDRWMNGDAEFNEAELGGRGDEWLRENVKPTSPSHPDYKERSGTIRKGYGFGWYGSAQRVLVRAFTALRQLGEKDLPEDAGIALGAILEDIGTLKMQLGVTEEMEKAGTLHEEAAGDIELEILKEVAKDTEGDVAEADDHLEDVGRPEETLVKDGATNEPKDELQDAEQQVHPTNVQVMVGAPSYTAKFMDLRDSEGAVLATLEDGELVIDEDEIRRTLEGEGAGGLYTVED